MSLKIGDIVPNFTAKDSHGEVFVSQSVLGRKPLVIYFYPKDNTPGCTTEACQFRDNLDTFDDLSIQVIGVSPDSSESHANFAEEHNLDFPLICDENLDLVVGSRNIAGGSMGEFTQWRVSLAVSPSPTKTWPR